ncbi:actin binding methyltransferase [Schizosaccharomyces japonicus yFS275]|uniref:tRNA N(3)-methylcytidine methyltransferase n=1 Tax=Schizosaccharomyces japonicus (strain yFS275 / FY16936) TaxID=402676 RepID=B6JVT2_SCHJY|nr:actin binding methyltransferase [Schizosaccharomyces japonicus yFS275]EEB05483.2 actin binding methyltransferase [Schizosaccharomyces japonicus yFS275]
MPSKQTSSVREASFSINEQFGGRILKKEEQVFEQNAWDHVEWDEEHIEYAKQCIEKQKQNPVAEVEKYMEQPASFWDKFYERNEGNFFMNRRWLAQEFPEIMEALKEDAGEKRIIEVGCGAGNTIWPILGANKNPQLTVFGVDYSSKAIDVVKETPAFQESDIVQASVWDLAGSTLPENVEPESCDIVILIFCFSALAPEQWEQSISNITRLLKPGGLVLFRDYGRWDMTQLRAKGNRLLGDNFYIRGDGTRVYFFTNEELENVFGSNFAVLQNGVDKRLLVNRKKKVKMYRCWLQAKFQKKIQS